jgi:hypothetical protein
MAYNEILAQRIKEQISHLPGFTEKKMFGGIGFMLHGNMACGVNGNELIVRLDPAQFEMAIRKNHVKIFDMTGKPMRGWVVVTPGGVESEQDLRQWIHWGVEFAQSLPPK